MHDQHAGHAHFTSKASAIVVLLCIWS